MKRIVTATVLNQAGVLNRVTGLFTRRNFNIESISVGHSETKGISRMTFTVNAENEKEVEQLIKQLNKQIDVLKVVDITDQAMVSRELALIKVGVNPQTRPEINTLIDPFRCKILDVAKDSQTIEVVGSSDKIEALIELLRPYGIKEMSRTGVTALPRGMQKQSTGNGIAQFAIIK